MPNEIFLIDSDVLITPYRTFYPFDMFPDFWRFVEKKIISKNILILDMIYDEIKGGGDQLSNWLCGIKNIELVEHKNNVTISQYGNILNYISNNALYQPEALNSWASKPVADPWLIAAALTHSYTVITLEKSNEGLSENQPSKKVKIPDICKQFNVKCNDLFYMMRQLNFKHP